MTTLRQLTVQTLTHLMAGGQEKLPVDDEARSILRQWMLDARTSGGRAAVPEASGKSNTADVMSVEEKLEFLRKKAAHWKPALGLGTLRETMVFATGNPHARLMLVGEAPGYDEERLGEPFVGKAGQLLNKILTAMGLSRAEVYITNVCKFRPSMGAEQGTANRAPTREEIAACLPLIMAEIRAIRPMCILCLGGTSAKALLGCDGSVSALRGRWMECQGIPLRVTYHPSYLLRNESMGARRSVWEDMLEVMVRLGMSISERQQQYFLPQ
ncbi:MAG: uracil-DNA glycosylase [Akkermansia sp.]|nr:uracil-DNA glycosylase [Akkermansia sp.]